MADLPDSGGATKGLSKQIGPLPLGVWIAVVGGGLAIAYFFNSRGGGRQQAPPPDSVIENPGVGSGGGLFAPITPPADEPAPEIKDNISWGRAAAKFLLGKNEDPGLVDAAIRNYLFGLELSRAEQAIINAAIRELGIPPEPLPPVKAPDPDPPIEEPRPPRGPIIIRPVPIKPAPQPPPPPPPPPPAPRPTGENFTVRPWPLPGSSLWSIAEMKYGNGALWPHIYNANRDKISNPDLIYAGWVLWVPYL